MKVMSATKATFASVETDIGRFRVWPSGTIEWYVDYDWAMVDDRDFDSGDLASVQAAGFEAMEG